MYWLWMKHNSLWTVFTRSLIFKKGSETKNMKAKDPFGVFFITEDHEDGQGSAVAQW